jgi:hypothetical protein
MNSGRGLGSVLDRPIKTGSMPVQGAASDSFGCARGGPNGSAPFSRARLERAMGKRTFRIILVKPSHYDDDGYVIQWRLSTIPSNSLASVYGLLASCAEEQALGPDVDIEIEAYDECNTVIDVRAAFGRIKAAGSGFVGLVGVQSNQFPRALDLAREFRAAGVPVVIGGFHVSGCISMLPELPPDLQEAQALGVILFAGECEGRMAELLRDIAADRAKPIHNYLHDMPSMEAAAIPVLPREVVGRIVGHHACFDAGRGCPFQCSFCTIINVQGRKSRYRTAALPGSSSCRTTAARNITPATKTVASPPAALPAVHRSPEGSAMRRSQCLSLRRPSPASMA